MIDYCAFCKDHHCLKWDDYLITRQELEEADELCHENWIEIENQHNYIKRLQMILDENGISYPKE